MRRWTRAALGALALFGVAALGWWTISSGSRSPARPTARQAWARSGAHPTSAPVVAPRPTAEPWPSQVAEPPAGVNLAPGPISVTTLTLPSGQPLEVADNELLLRIRDEAQAARLLQALGGRVVQRSAHGPYRRVLLDGRLPLPEALAVAARSPGVADVGPNAVIRGARRRDDIGEPWSEFLWQTTGRDNESVFDWTSAWAIAPRAEGVVVAVLDSGVAYEDHRDDTGTYRQASDIACSPFIPGHDHINDDAFSGDDHQHGTHIASLIASDPDCGSLVQGYAPGVTLMPIKVLDGSLAGTEMALVEGLHEAVDGGAQVINMSLAFGQHYYPSPMLDEALRHAAEAGVVMVAAAGNSGDQAVAWPAASPLVIAVGGIRFGGFGNAQLAKYSQRGPAIDVLAAGGGLDQDKNKDGLLDGVVAQSIAPHDPSQIGYFAGAGTSQAAAAVSGLAALMIAAGADPADVPEMVRQAGKDRDFDDESGYGAVIPRAAVESARDAQMTRAPTYYVELVGAIRADSADRAACLGLRVVDVDFRPVRDVKIYGRWQGPFQKVVSCKTNDRGTCRIKSDKFRPSSATGAVIGFSAQALVNDHEIDGRKLAVRPTSFYQMPQAQAQAIADWGLERESGVVARAVTPSRDTEDLVGCDHLLGRSYMIHNLGVARASSPTLFLLDETAMRGIDPTFDGQAGPVDGNGLGGAGLGASSFVAWFNPSWGLNFGILGSGLGASSWVVNNSLNVWSPGATSFWATWGAGLGASSLVPFPAGFQLYGFANLSLGLGLDGLETVEGASQPQDDPELEPLGIIPIAP